MTLAMEYPPLNSRQRVLVRGQVRDLIRKIEGVERLIDRERGDGDVSSIERTLQRYRHELAKMNVLLGR
jgi:hypothetical protein